MPATSSLFPLKTVPGYPHPNALPILPQPMPYPVNPLQHTAMSLRPHRSGPKRYPASLVSCSAL
jgi:hypothetical protein